MKPLFVSAFIFFMALGSPVQITRNDPHKIQPVLDMLAEIDAANQVLPIVLTKEQIKKLLPVIEKCRQNVRNQEKKEADRLKALKAEADKVHAEAVRGLVPSQEFLDKVNKLFDTFDNEARGVIIANTIIILDALKGLLHEGQKRAVIGVVDKIYNEETKTWEEGSDERKLGYFGIRVLLSDSAYQLLVKLSMAK